MEMMKEHGDDERAWRGWERGEEDAGRTRAVLKPRLRTKRTCEYL
jgi:hypothetical protein